MWVLMFMCVYMSVFVSVFVYLLICFYDIELVCLYMCQRKKVKKDLLTECVCVSMFSLVIRFRTLDYYV